GQLTRFDQVDPFGHIHFFSIDRKLRHDRTFHNVRPDEPQTQGGTSPDSYQSASLKHPPKHKWYVPPCFFRYPQQPRYLPSSLRTSEAFEEQDKPNPSLLDTVCTARTTHESRNEPSSPEPTPYKHHPE